MSTCCNCVFLLEAAAQLALSVINLNMGYPNANTQSWAVVRKKYGVNEWYFLKPDNAYMTGVVGYIEQDFDRSWVNRSFNQ